MLPFLLFLFHVKQRMRSPAGMDFRLAGQQSGSGCRKVRQDGEKMPG